MTNTNKPAYKNKKSISRSTLLGAAAAAAVMFLLLTAYMFFKPVPMAGSKTMSIEVVYEDGSKDDYQVTTDAHFLKEAADAIPELTIEGTTTEEFGLMIDTVNGVKADYQADGAYWALLCEGRPCNYGISQQPIKDGEHYSIVYTPAGE